ncbi:hypothetical protein QQS21_010314 [Conoideocrella luteorostrata]|uniref:Uncharacterized protein n=1 Tax=Conoideocrella luteorostrata TaxID=1105319 RepID=A0AAJ0CHK1_9HYPO|nr:hypothetical protein QQS21_010314 [Conoideocrella luteorostrata]
MARKLPWKRTGVELKPEAGSSHQRTYKAEVDRAVVPACTPGILPTPTRDGDSHTQQPRDDVDQHQHQHQNISSPPRSNLTPSRWMDGRIRSPSTSPPPEPPAQEFMIPSDDRFRMVEDELLRTAGLFTAHLHRAEYNRLKMLTQRHNADTIREIERPVVQLHGGGATSTARRRGMAARRNSRQRAVLQANGGVSDLPWVGTSLQGLMEKKSGRMGTGIRMKIGSGDVSTRAAAGFASRADKEEEQQEQQEQQEYEDVRDSERHTEIPVTPRQRAPRYESPAGPGPSSSASITLNPRGNFHSSSAGGGGGSGRAYYSKDVDESPYSSGSKRSAKHIHPGPREAQVEEGGNGDEPEEDDPFGVNKRRVSRVQSREQMRRPAKDTAKKLSPDAIPSFL